jgi:hypothetical protein
VDVGERSIVVHHAMPTPNCNTSNTRVFDPFNPPTSRSQHLLAPHLIHGTVEQRIHVLLLLLTNLPLDCVAATGGYVGDLQMQDTGYLTSVSMDGEYTFSTFSERREWLLRASATLSNGERCSRSVTGDCRPSSLTCFQPWLRPLRLSRMTDSLDHLRRRRA